MLALLFISAGGFAESTPVFVTVEPDDFQEGQALTNVVEGVMLSVANGSGVPQATSQVEAFDGDLSSTGNFVFGRKVQAFAPDDFWFLTSLSTHSVFRADFDVPVAQVSIDVIRTGQTAGALLAYDSSGTLLESTVNSPGAPGTFSTAAINRPTADIAFILAGGYPSVSSPPFNVVALDNLRYSYDPSLPTPFVTGEYFPLRTGDHWEYQVDGNASLISVVDVLAGTFTVNGIPTKALQIQDPDGTTTNYFTNDSNGIRFHRQTADGDEVTFSPPIRMANAEAFIGDEISTNGIATLFLAGQGTFQLDFTATSRILAYEPVAVPAGQFQTVKVELTFNLTGSVFGMPVDETEVDTYWLARYIGPVKATVFFEGATTTNELISAFVDHDSDGLSATVDNCPVINNPAQTNSDGDGQGDACDEDDDNDGVPDDFDDFPLDPGETTDTDGDGIGNNADLDDDNDLLPDEFEIANGLDPLNAADAAEDQDADGFSNIAEYQAGTNINDPRSNPAANAAAVGVILKLILDDN